MSFARALFMTRPSPPSKTALQEATLVLRHHHHHPPSHFPRALFSCHVCVTSGAIFSLACRKKTMRVFGGGAGRDREHRDRSGERSERQVLARESAGDSSGGSGSIRGGSGGGGAGGVEVGGIFAPVPKRPDRSASPGLAASLVESSSVFMSTTKRRADRTPSPSATTHRRASYPSHTRPWNFADFRGAGSR